VLTPRDAARLLTDPDSSRTTALVAALGFAAPLTLDRSIGRRLGLGTAIRGPQLAVGRGTLRALIVQVPDADAPEVEAAALARTLARQAPECLWLVIAERRTDGVLTICAPPPGGTGAVPALVVDRTQLRESDAETLSALVGAAEGPDLMVHARWRETLGRDALSTRFYRELEGRVAALAETAVGPAPAEARRTIALLHTSRLLFVAFLEARGWLDDDREFLRRQFTARAGGRGAHRRMLEPLWFGTLNTPPRARAATARSFGRIPFLNGGLFTRTPLERRWRALTLHDDAIGEIIGGLLARYRLTARESREAWSDSAVDPEMLGRAFESLMHAGTRRAQGAFYTPPPLVSQLTRDGIAAALAPHRVPTEVFEAAWHDASLPATQQHRRHSALSAAQQDALRAALDDFRVLDPACGSGAFLVFALEALSALRRAGGDTRGPAVRHRHVLTHAIFGVDVDPTAVWLCQLRLWLAVMVEEPDDASTQLLPLPNLDHNVREGDALAGRGFEDAVIVGDPQLAVRRLRYTRASGARKQTLGKALAREERARVIAMHDTRVAQLTARRRELLAAVRSPDLFLRTRGADARARVALEDLRLAVRRARRAADALRLGAALPFSFATHFPEAAARGGFTLLLGNPPWVRTHGIPAEQRASMKERFAVFQQAAWESGAAAAAAGRGFASQVDLAALFTERALRLAQPAGVIALLLPAKLWGSLAGGGVRALLAAEAPPLMVEDWSGSSAGFDAVVYPSSLVARRARPSESPGVVRTTVHRADTPLTWNVDRSLLPLDDSPGAPWMLLPPEVRCAFDALTAAGTPLGASVLGRPLLGVKSGCNEAFVLSVADAEDAGIEPDCLRPLLRGEHLDAWRPSDASESARIIWTHDVTGAPRATLPPATMRRLAAWRRTLEQRSDARGARWWALFRTEAARSDCPRVVWGDIGRSPRALVLARGDTTVPLNTCYVVRTRCEDDAHALAVLLNSSVGAAWLGALAEPARGGYRRYMGWTCARFPVPAAWDSARTLLAPIGRAAAAGHPPDPWTLTEQVLRAYQLRHGVVAPLLSWHGL
jgi:hypothetical protein